MIVSISWREWLVDLHVIRYATQEHARRHVEAMDPERTAYFVDTDSPSPWSELGSYCTRNLVQIANALNAGKPADHRTVHHDDALARVADRIVAIAKQREVMDTDTNTETNETETEGAPSTRPFKPIELGPFSPVRDGTKLADLLRLAAAGGRTYAQLAEASQLTLAGVSGRLRGGLGRDHGIGHTVDAATGEVVITAPEGKTLDDLIKVRAEPAPRQVREPRAANAPKIGAFKPVRPGTRLHSLIKMMDNGGATLAEMATTLKDSYVDKDVLWWLKYSLRRDHGIDFTVDEATKVYRLALPDGKTVDDCVKAAA